MKSLFVVFTSALFWTASIHAQSAFMPTGADVVGTTGASVSYSVGQVAYINYTTAGAGRINEGVQQPYEFFIVGIDPAIELTISCRLYPNPSADMVVLSVDNPMAHTLHFALFDLQGRVLLQQTLTDKETFIPIEHLPSATYLLKVGTAQTNQTFKLVKIH